MERLTKRIPIGPLINTVVCPTLPYFEEDESGYERVFQSILDKLAAYEDAEAEERLAILSKNFKNALIHLEKRAAACATCEKYSLDSCYSCRHSRLDDGEVFTIISEILRLTRSKQSQL